MQLSDLGVTIVELSLMCMDEIKAFEPSSTMSWNRSNDDKYR